MPRQPKTPTPKRMASYRHRMRAAGLRPVQIWVPDSRSPRESVTVRRAPWLPAIRRATSSCALSPVSINGRSLNAARSNRSRRDTGDYGKPRPALIVQSELFAEMPSVVICPLTTTLRNDADQFRLEVEPSERNGLPRFRKSQSTKSLLSPSPKSAV